MKFDQEDLKAIHKIARERAKKKEPCRISGRLFAIPTADGVKMETRADWYIPEGQPTVFQEGLLNICQKPAQQLFHLNEAVKRSEARYPKNPCADYLVRVGDRVAYYVRHDNRWVTEKVPYGTLGTVVSMNTYIRYYDIDEQSINQPGKYQGNACPNVQFDDGTLIRVSCVYLQMLNVDMQAREADRAYREEFNKKIFLEPLPELPFTVGDHVEYDERDYGLTECVVIKITYDPETSFTVDESTTDAGHTYTLRSVEHEWQTTVPASNIGRLIARGNYYKWMNNLKDELTFESLSKEIAFFMSLGFCKQLCCSVTGNYEWTLEAATEALKAGEVHLFKMSTDLFDSKRFLTCYTFTGNDPLIQDLAQRVVNETKRGFNITS